MESITVLLDDAAYDAAVHAKDALPECANIKLCLKRKGTVSGKATVCITWSVLLPSGMTATCQATTTLNSFVAAARLMEGAERISRVGR
jgi:hypothetical protein